MTTPHTDDTAQIPWAQTQTIPYAAPPAPPTHRASQRVGSAAADGERPAGGCVAAVRRSIRFPRFGGARAGGDHAAYLSGWKALQRKDFRIIPVCGSLRPLDSQQRQSAGAVD